MEFKERNTDITFQDIPLAYSPMFYLPIKRSLLSLKKSTMETNSPYITLLGCFS